MNLFAKLFKKSSCKAELTYGQQPSYHERQQGRRSSSALSFHCPDTPSDPEEDTSEEAVWTPGVRGRRQAIDVGARNSCALAESVVHSRLRPPRRSQTYSAALPIEGSVALDDARLSTASTSSDNHVPDLHTSYRHIHHRYRGSNCEVLEAVSKATAKNVMIKAFNNSRMTASLRERRCREVELLQAAAAAAVPNVMRFVATLENEHQTCTIVERSSGVTLIELMANSGGHIHEDACRRRVALPLLQAVAGLHALGVMHRHLKPEHLLCSPTSLVVVDFTDAVHMKQHCLNSRVGDLHYMAPEVLSKPRAEDIFHQVLFQGMAEEELPQYDEKADIFSVGVILFEALTGLQPFMADMAKDMVAVQQAKLSALNADGMPEFIAEQQLSVHAKEFLALLLKEEPKQRPSAEQLLEHPWLMGAQAFASIGSNGGSL